jgi:hypothetical protein
MPFADDLVWLPAVRHVTGFGISCTGLVARGGEIPISPGGPFHLLSLREL